MSPMNKTNQLSIAQINESEEKQIRELEQKLGDKYYLIAYAKDRS